MVRFHYSNIRVKFEGEDGSGPGVNRGFFASLANEVKSSDTTRPPLNRLGLLFYQPGKQPEQQGLYAPCPMVLPSSNSIGKNACIKVCAVQQQYIQCKRELCKYSVVLYTAFSLLVPLLC